MAREGLIDDTGYEFVEIECPDEVDEDICSNCIQWNIKGKYCEERNEEEF